MHFASIFGNLLQQVCNFCKSLTELHFEFFATVKMVWYYINWGSSLLDSQRCFIFGDVPTHPKPFQEEAKVQGEEEEIS